MPWPSVLAAGAGMRSASLSRAIAAWCSLLAAAMVVAGARVQGAPKRKSPEKQVLRPASSYPRELTDLGQAVLSSAFWTHFDWASPDADRLIVGVPEIAGFDPDKHTFGENRAVRLGDVSFLGKPGRAIVLRRPEGLALGTGLLVQVTDGLVKANCDSAGAALVDSLGEPAVDNDLSWHGDKIDTTSYRKQWEVPPSRVELEGVVFDFVGSDRSPIGWMAVSGWHQSVGPRDTPLSWIKCDATLQVEFEDGSPSPGPKVLRPIVLGIDDYRHQVYSEGHGPLGNATFSGGRITIVVQGEGDRVDEITIDRRTGTYHDVRRLSALTATSDGTCSKFDPAATKF